MPKENPESKGWSRKFTSSGVHRTKKGGVGKKVNTLRGSDWSELTLINWRTYKKQMELTFNRNKYSVMSLRQRGGMKIRSSNSLWCVTFIALSSRKGP